MIRKCPGKRTALVSTWSILRKCRLLSVEILRLCEHYAAAAGSNEDKAIRGERGLLRSASDAGHAFPRPDHLAFDVLGTGRAGLSPIGT